MKTPKKMLVYTNEPSAKGWRFSGQKPLTRAQEKALEIPDPSEAASVLHMVAKGELKLTFSRA